MAANKQTKDFTLWGIKFTDIQINNYGTTEIFYYIGTVGTAQMVRQYIYNKYAKYSKGLKVNSDKFSGGSSIDVYFNRLPEDIFKEIKKELIAKFDFHESDPSSDYYNNKTNILKSKEGVNIEYAGTFFHVHNEPKFGSKEYDEPAPDWAKSTPSSSGKRTYPNQNDKGGLIQKFDEGWELYGKTVNGKLVYNIYTTKQLKRISLENFSAFKGEVLVETEFKWNPRFQCLEKWIGVANDGYRIDLAVPILQKIITKYYSTETKQEEKQESVIDKLFDLLTDAEGVVWDELKLKDGTTLYNSDEIQKKYSLLWKDELLKPIYSEITLTPDEWLEIKGKLTDDNYHSLNNLLALWGFYGEVGKQGYITSYNRTANEKNKYYLNPSIIMPVPQPTTESKPQTKESVEKAIKALQVLANMGDEKAAKAIKALKYLI